MNGASAADAAMNNQPTKSLPKKVAMAADLDSGDHNVRLPLSHVSPMNFQISRANSSRISTLRALSLWAS